MKRGSGAEKTTAVPGKLEARCPRSFQQSATKITAEKKGEHIKSLCFNLTNGRSRGAARKAPRSQVVAANVDNNALNPGDSEEEVAEPEDLHPRRAPKGDSHEGIG